MAGIEFGFKPDRKTFLSELLSKAKPRLPAARIEFFLSECERGIKLCLRCYPAGWQTDERTPKRVGRES